VSKGAGDSNIRQSGDDEWVACEREIEKEIWAMMSRACRAGQENVSGIAKTKGNATDVTVVFNLL
jgi:hypothetical protein